MSSTSTTTTAEFLSYWPSVKEEIIKAVRSNLPSQQHTDRINLLLEYNVPKGKLNRGICVVDTFKALGSADDVKRQDKVAQAHVLGWCIELLQASFLVLDDIMDSSATRRGQPCWYKIENVGLAAVNDGLIIESVLYILLKAHFSSDPNYVHFLEFFREITLKTTLGQMLDVTMANQIDVEIFNIQRYNEIVKFKTAFYSFFLPFACGLVLAGIIPGKNETCNRIFQITEEISLLLGEYFQIQDDYLDCYGDVAITGKIGTDIEDGKLSWLAIQALYHPEAEKFNVLQLFNQHYGRADPASTSIIKDLFNKLELPRIYRDYEEEARQNITNKINQVTVVDSIIFRKIFDKIYKRDK